MPVIELYPTPFVERRVNQNRGLVSIQPYKVAAQASRQAYPTRGIGTFE